MTPYTLRNLETHLWKTQLETLPNTSAVLEAKGWKAERRWKLLKLDDSLRLQQSEQQQSKVKKREQYAKK